MENFRVFCKRNWLKIIDISFFHMQHPWKVDFKIVGKTLISIEKSTTLAEKKANFEDPVFKI